MKTKETNWRPSLIDMYNLNTENMNVQTLQYPTHRDTIILTEILQSLPPCLLISLIVTYMYRPGVV